MNTAEVTLYGTTMGYIHWNDSRGIAEFEYTPAFAATKLEPAPLTMPVRPGITYSFPELRGETFRGLPGIFADSLPDRYGRQLMRTYLATIGKTEENALEALCYLGKRCMGALEFKPAYERTGSAKTDFEISALVNVASEALSRKEDFATNLQDDEKQAIADILSLSTSAGGQRAKAVIAYNKATGEVRSGQIEAPGGFKHYLIKLDGIVAGQGLSATQNFGRLEYSFYKLARTCGIEMTDTFLVEENGRAHFVTERFDRDDKEKVHMQTLCGIAHYDFNMLRAFSWEQAFGVMRQLHLPYPQMEQLYRRLTFNVIVRNQDDHTKNISFLMDANGAWRLSPAYDMGYNYNPSGGWTSRHQMSVEGKFDNIGKDDLLRFAEKISIKDAEKIIGEISGACATWPNIASDCSVPGRMIELCFRDFILL